jgi:hypothetical protein
MLQLPKTLTLKVAQGDIDAGAPQQPESCAVAQSLRRRFKDSDVDVLCHNDITVILGYEAVRYEVVKDPENSFDKYLNDFDAGRRVEPRTFSLRRTGGCGCDGCR